MFDCKKILCAGQGFLRSVPLFIASIDLITVSSIGCRYRQQTRHLKNPRLRLRTIRHTKIENIVVFKLDNRLWRDCASVVQHLYLLVEVFIRTDKPVWMACFANTAMLNVSHSLQIFRSRSVVGQVNEASANRSVVPFTRSTPLVQQAVDSAYILSSLAG